ERKRALAALRTSEMQYRSVIENIQDVFYRSDTAGRLLMGSPSGARMFGYDSVDEMLGMPLDSFWPDPMERQQLLAQVRATGSARDYEAVLRRKDGSTFNALFATHFYYDDDGNLLGTEGIIRDVTERKRAEEALRQANLVVENSPVVLFRWRAAEGWPVEMVSRNVSQLGYTPEELLSGAIPFASMVHPEDLDRVAREVREYTATGVDRFQQEYRIITKDGEERWVDDRTQVERDGDGQITHYQGIVIDITERKRAEEALLQEKHFTDTLIDSMPGMFYLFDEQARLARWNKQFEQSTGYDAESISRTSALDFIHPEDRNLVAEKIREVFIHGESHVEGRVVTRHGGTIPFYLTGLRITFGDKTYLLGVGLDISERVRVEAESARLQVLLRSVILQSPVPMVLVLPDGTVELFNEGCRSVLGVPEGLELPPDLNLFTLEKTWIDYSAEGSQLPLAELPLTLALQGKTTRSREMKVLRQDGTERWILVDAVPVVDDHSIVIAGFLIFIDITERKRAEEILHESMRRLQTVVNGAPVVLYSFDRHGVFTLSEGKGLVGLGIKPGEIVGRTIFEVYGDQPASIAALHRAMAGETFTLELSFPAGGTFEASHIAMFNDAGDYNGTIGVLVDITERKRAEEALRESEGRFTQVFQSAPVPMAFASDVDSFRATTWNEAWYQAFGYPREQAEGRSGADIGLWVNPDDRSRFIEMANRQNEVTGFETLMRRHDGAVLHCSLFGRFIGKAGHRLLMAVYLDITERKRAEVALRVSEERYRLLFSSINDAVFVHRHVADGLPGQFIEVNDIACERLGYTRRELLEMRPMDIDAPEMRDLVPTILKRLSAEGQAVWEGVHVSKAGRRIPVEISNRMFELGGETVVLSAVRDISERKEAEDEKRRLRNYLANIIDSMPSVLVGVDMSGCVTQWNAAAQKRTGIQAQQAQGQPLDLVLPDLGGHLDRVREAIRSRTVKIENRVPMMADGDRRYQDITVYPLVSNGLEGAVIRVDDVTERVQIEEMMIQSEKMLSVGGLAAGMAHEINNPLGAILQASQNIVRRVSTDLPVNLRVAEACGTTLDAVRNYLQRREILSFLDDIRDSGLRA
ncbi:MAG TPA: hypothetical protein DEO88_03120, partial [Syntrophobacteraceae bacterium]|nr:hypothetical protein [Syntrophobacteraceae bacterium]